MKWLIEKVIVLYQKTVSFDHGVLAVLRPYGMCRYYPSCSEYARRAVKQQGAVKGISLALWRVLRCNPLSNGGYDPVSQVKAK